MGTGAELSLERVTEQLRAACLPDLARGTILSALQEFFHHHLKQGFFASQLLRKLAEQRLFPGCRLDNSVSSDNTLQPSPCSFSPPLPLPRR